jgi:hypothetical protein
MTSWGMRKEGDRQRQPLVDQRLRPTSASVQARPLSCLTKPSYSIALERSARAFLALAAFFCLLAITRT